MMPGLLIAAVCYAGIASPGHSYAMSGSHWVNTGNAPRTVTLIDNDPWLRLGKTSFTLRPGQSADVPVTLVLPGTRLRRGVYTARLRATSGASQPVMFGVGVRAHCAGPAGPPLPPGRNLKALPVLGLGIAAVAVVLMLAAMLRVARDSLGKRTWGRDMTR